MSARQPYLIARMQGLGTTIFSEMTALAHANEAVNLGQGFPDEDGPDEVKAVATRAIDDGINQYAPGNGIGRLRHAIAAHQQRFHGLAYDPETEITVTAGATEAITAAVLALTEVGDEVVCFEPYYDSYVATIALAGGVRRPVTLRPGAHGYGFEPAALDHAITPRTRLLLLNSPHNPTGKVFSREELELIASRCVEHDLVAVTDEVYEHLVFDGEHVPLATLPGMRERTVTISSGAKSFSFTGWKIGWVCAPPDLLAAVQAVKQWLSFSNGTPFQHAIAHALQLDDDYFGRLLSSYRTRRDRLVAGLAEVGMEPITPAGTYFVTADIRPLGYRDGLRFCRTLPERVGVAAVPCVSFYDDIGAGAPLVRFAFCKLPEVIDEGLARLAKLPHGNEVMVG